MIRAVQNTDIDQVADIWLDTNIKSHHFISAQYWQENFEAVKEMLRHAEAYCYINEASNTIQGFIGLEGSYIAGIFVCGEAQSCGIGKQLLDSVKERKPELRLHVYKKNTRAIRFYLKEGFRICDETQDRNTKEDEYAMIWKR